MDEALQDAAAAFRIVTVKCLHHASFVTGSGIDTRRLSTAGTGLRYHILIVSTVQIFLHMGNDHIAFGNQNTASGIQFQVFDKSQVMEACPRYFAAVDFHGVKYCNR